MPLRSTERSDGRNRPRWKDGSQPKVGEQQARQPTDVAITDNAAGMTAHETELARDRRWDAEADAGLQKRSWRGAQMRLAILPYGRNSKGPPRSIAERPRSIIYVNCALMHEPAGWGGLYRRFSSAVARPCVQPSCGSRSRFAAGPAHVACSRHTFVRRVVDTTAATCRA